MQTTSETLCPGSSRRCRQEDGSAPGGPQNPTRFEGPWIALFTLQPCIHCFFSLFGRTGLHRKLMTIWLWLATCLRGRAEMRVHGQPLNFVTDLKKKTPVFVSRQSITFHTAWPSLSDLGTSAWKNSSAWCGNSLTIAVWLHSD